MILKWRTLFFTFSIIRYNSDRDLPSVLPNNSESLLNILIPDSFVVAIDSGISYKGNILAFLAVIVTLKSLLYLYYVVVTILFFTSNPKSSSI